MQEPPLEPDRYWQPIKGISDKPSTPAMPIAAKKTNSLIKILAASIFSAVLLIVGLVQFYGRQQGQATMDRFLVSPSSLEQLYFNDLNFKDSKKVAFSLDKILYTPAGVEVKGPVTIKLEDYADLFEMIKKNASLRLVTPELERRFNDPIDIHRLSIHVKEHDKTNSSQEPILYQQIEILDSSPYYRISLPLVAMADPTVVEWKYFKHESTLGPLIRKILNSKG